MSNAREIAQLGSIPSGRRNMLYNGAMQVAQRGTSFASTSAPAYTLDRWYWNSQAEDVVTIEQSTDHPNGSGSSLKVTVTTADASTTDDYADIEQRIEGLDLQGLLYGTADAKSLTLSFWVKSSETGDMAVGLYIPDDGRNIGSTVTISSASTWEYKTVTFVGDTTGVIDNDSGEGLRVWMHLLAGSDFTSVDNTAWGTYAGNRKAYGQTLNVIGTTSATFQLADVQLEVGSVATEFEHRSYGEELALCQRYYYRWEQGNSGVSSHALHIIAMFTSTRGFFGFSPPVPMRAVPSVGMFGTLSLTIPDLTVNGTVNSATVYAYDNNYSRFSIDTDVTGSTANVYRSLAAGVNSGIQLIAEL